ncbi:MAG: rhodanese-like domain-containing protein [Campylobacterales bacterium]|nr:rhodanese-like domain-containing protein [Campylobacterales bacterium]
MLVTPSFVKQPMTIIDIRTEPEWRETGLVSGAIPLTFFDEKGRYDTKVFLAKLEKYVTKETPFALICRTGNRTSAVSEFLGELGYAVINLQGGMVELVKQGYQPVPYRP